MLRWVNCQALSLPASLIKSQLTNYINCYTVMFQYQRLTSDPYNKDFLLFKSSCYDTRASFGTSLVVACNQLLLIHLIHILGKGSKKRFPLDDQSSLGVPTPRQHSKGTSYRNPNLHLKCPQVTFILNQHTSKRFHMTNLLRLNALLIL